MAENSDDTLHRRRMSKIFNRSLEKEEQNIASSLQLRPQLRSNASRILSKSYDVSSLNSETELDNEKDLNKMHWPANKSYMSRNFGQKITDYGVQRSKHSLINMNISERLGDEYVSPIEFKQNQHKREIKIPIYSNKIVLPKINGYSREKRQLLKFNYNFLSGQQARVVLSKF